MSDLTDVALAESLAKTAGEIAISIRNSGLLIGKLLGDAGDHGANAFLIDAIRKVRPNDGILSEESRDDLTRLNKERVWIIDPVDGTREFSEARDDWAVHIGLSIGGEPKIGAVALPDKGLVLSTGNQANVAPRKAGPLRMVVSRSRPPEEAKRVAEAIGAELVGMGSAGAKSMAVVTGEADIYLHAGGQYQWDNCAPAAVALAAGYHASRLDLSPLTYNLEDTYLPDLVICRPELKSDVERAIK